MIGPDINRAKSILAMKTNFANGVLYHRSLLRVNWLMLQLSSLGSFKPGLGSNAWCSVNFKELKAIVPCKKALSLRLTTCVKS